jgi:hypothetical protein
VTDPGATAGTTPLPAPVPAAPPPPERDLAERVAAAVRAVPTVHDLHGGVFGEVATYLPGRRVGGVKLTERGCEIHLAAVASVPLADTVAAVRAAVAPLVDGPVDIVVEDVVAAAGGSP